MTAPWEKFQQQDAKPWEKFQESKPVEPQREYGFGEKLDAEIKDIPRQLGLTARYGIEGLGGTANFLASPFRGALNLAGMNIAPMNPKGWADSMGLPEPKNAKERVIGDATTLGFGSAVPIGLASGVSKLPMGANPAAVESVSQLTAPSLASNTTRSVAAQMAANPAAQIVSSAAAGGAGGYTRETGGGAGAQFLSSLAAGVLAPAAMRSGQGVFNWANQTIKPKDIGSIDVRLEGIFKDSGINFSELPMNVRNSIRADVTEALKTGDLSPDAVRRLADYRLVGATPSQAGLTLDPVKVTQQKNLAKLGANSKDEAAQILAQIENRNNQRLVENLNDMGATRGFENEAAGESLVNSLSALAKAKKNEISGLYQAARDSSGRAAPLEPWTFTKNLDEKLSYANGNIFLPKEVRMMVNNFANGKAPLNVDTAEQFKTVIGNEIVKANAAGNGNAVNALRLVRETLDETPLLTQAQRAGGNQLAAQGQTAPQLGQEAIDAFTKARSANRQFMQQVEQTPALAAAMDDASVKGFFDKYVIRGDSKQLGNMLKAVDPETIGVLRQNVLAHLKEKAVGGRTDELGNFSYDRFNSALKMLGNNKLNMLFSPEEVAQLKAVARVAGYESFQPKGSAVNNSNTAAAAGGMLERIANSPLLSKLPFGRVVSEPIQNISIGIGANKALNTPMSLIQQPTQDPSRYLLPYAGLLGTASNYGNQ